MKRKTIFTCILSLLLVICMLTGCAKTAPTEDTTDKTSDKVTENTEPEKDEPILRFAAISDTHIGDENTEESMRRMLGYINEYAGEIDAIVFSGDLTNTTASTASSEQVELFKQIYEDEVPYGAQMIYCLGPTHDIHYDKNGKDCRQIFRDALGEDYFANDLGDSSHALNGARHIEIGGYDFFTLDWEGDENGYDADTMAWLKDEIDAAAEKDPEKPFFVSAHVPGMAEINELLADYPQAVCFTGHLHDSVAREDSITQENGYTSVHCGGTNYYRVDGYNRFNDNPFLELGNIYEFAQCLFVEVYADNTVKITRLDGYNGAVIGDVWEISPDNYTSYTNKRRAGALSTFNPDSDMKITESDSSVTVAFDAADPRKSGAVLYYSIAVYQNVDGEYALIQQADIASREVFYPNRDFPELFYTYTFEEVDTSDYAVAVTAYDCWGPSSNSMVYTNGSYEHSDKTTGNVVCETAE
ncbi:MAG: metallophosphoesterase [Clostridia bacterium]|nr:metallophosphoesterase [Clostridia bacterium]